MESSETQKRIINLGKTLVQELGLDPGVDTLARWMAHYVAEQMTIAENATGDDKITAEQHCFETILRLWQHRSSLPNGQRPFKNFEPIFRTLARLDPENPTPYFYPNPNIRSSGLDDSGEDSDEIQQWLDIALGIDQAARIWLEYIFHQAALNATDEQAITWLENAVGLSATSSDISIIVRLAQLEPENESEETAERERRVEQERLRSRIEKLDAFIDFSRNLRAAFVTELEIITQSDSSSDTVDM